VPSFFELLLTAGSRPALTLGRLIRDTGLLAVRPLGSPDRVPTAPSASMLSNRLRQDMGLPPLDSGDLPL
jgi:hypothetical protein